MDPKVIEFKRLEKQYRNHPDKKRILIKAQRRIFVDDMLQPGQARFKEVWKKSQVAREATDRAVDRELVREKEELERIYRAKNGRRTKTLHQKMLEDLHKEHPNMVTEEAILKWQT